MKKLLIVSLLASGSCVYASETKAPVTQFQNKEDVLAKFQQLKLKRDAAVATHAQAEQASQQAKIVADALHDEYKRSNQQAKDLLEKTLNARKEEKELQKKEKEAHQESRQARKTRNAEVANFNTAAQAYNQECWTRATTYSLEQEEAVSEDETKEEAPAQEKQQEKTETYVKKTKGRKNSNQ